ncbi:NADH-quinone oxidoreductase subunit L [Rubellimicrobium roseum]|uniref:NADH-quinone oxidoreductase subunit L n=1 Tax=Rubellimicrobium roseum TaxID=687525 RepID=A0A5C4NM30_9RHOB|nr:NADH-quinone oxidoreductase subunit L [Rubellimicrobium roseum]TNC73747.1 NADH-quinone oxidoreductase subunit L [Rubellimicrobium roseum]
MTTIILFAPLIGSLVCGFGWRFLGEQAACWFATAMLGLAAFLSWIVFFTVDGPAQHVEIMRWIQSGTLDSAWSIRLDRLTAIMLVVINTVSALVHLYSVGYMAHDENFHEGESYRPRFFSYLSLFTFAMLTLVTADNLLQLFFGWEGVGLASYLLIGFYFRKPSANAAQVKAFVVNRVGDFAFLLGIFTLYFLVDSIRLDDIFAAVGELAQTEVSFAWSTFNAAELVAFLLFFGAMGKSAQLFLHTWLPDAMEGPTPVSALIHAATMVTAGVFLLCRMSPVFEVAPYAKNFIVYVGASTAFFAATVGLVQNDIKRVIAYSTCSQLGYMFVAAGAGVYGAAMFHLFTHAFFKAMLFLGAGSVIHATHHEQDMRNYGGLRTYIPYTYWAMVIGTLAITGVGIPLTYIGFAGFLSKDAIIETAWASGNGFAFWALVIAACFTAFYSWRLIFLTFFGQPRWGHASHAHDPHAFVPADGTGSAPLVGTEATPHGHDHHDDHHHVPHESPTVMLVPLGVLALGAVFAGMIWHNSFFGDHERMTAFFDMPHGEEHGSEARAGDAHSEGEAHAEAGATPEEAAAEDGQASEAAPEEATAAPTEESDVLVPGLGGAIAMNQASEAVLDAAHHSPALVKLSPFLAMLIGTALAYVMYIRRPDLPGRIAATNRPLYEFLLNKWYFDEIYDAVFVRPAAWLGSFLWRRGDGTVIDGTINGVAMGVIPTFTRLAGRFQSGYVFHYAFTMVVGIAILLTWFTITGGAE